MGSAQQSIKVLSNQLVYREAAAEREPFSSISTPSPTPLPFRPSFCLSRILLHAKKATLQSVI